MTHTAVVEAEPSVANLIDLARYPILDLTAAAAQALAHRCRQQLDQTGACELPGFLTPRATTLLARESEGLAKGAYRSEGFGTAYLEIPDFALPEDHPRRILGRSSVGVVAYDMFPADSLTRRLYEWEPLMQFIAAALGKERLCRYADPLGALNLAVMQASDELHWHYDQTDFVTSIALQDADAGGDFEYAPLIRSATEENYPRVERLLRGGREDVVRIPMCPGTLLLFEGRNSIHRVTQIAGSTERLVALLAYDTKPGTRSSEVLQMARYGRTKQ